MYLTEDIICFTDVELNIHNKKTYVGGWMVLLHNITSKSADQ